MAFSKNTATASAAPASPPAGAAAPAAPPPQTPAAGTSHQAPTAGSKPAAPPPPQIGLWPLLIGVVLAAVLVALVVVKLTGSWAIGLAVLGALLLVAVLAWLSAKNKNKAAAGGKPAVRPGFWGRMFGGSGAKGGGLGGLLGKLNPFGGGKGGGLGGGGKGGLGGLFSGIKNPFSGLGSGGGGGLGKGSGPGKGSGGGGGWLPGFKNPFSGFKNPFSGSGSGGGGKAKDKKDDKKTKDKKDDGPGGKTTDTGSPPGKGEGPAEPTPGSHTDEKEEKNQPQGGGDMGKKGGSGVGVTGHESLYVWLRDVTERAMPQALIVIERRFARLLAEAPGPIHPQLIARVEGTLKKIRAQRERAAKLGAMARALHADVVQAVENGRRQEETADVAAAWKDLRG